MDEKQKINELIKQYQEAIHTQNVQNFRSLWTCDENNIMISVVKKFYGIDAICEDFLIGCIQKAYTTIDLIMDKIDICIISDTLATVILEYHTDCIKRETGERYGIQGVETQLMIKVDNEWKLQHVHYSKG